VHLVRIPKVRIPKVRIPKVPIPKERIPKMRIPMSAKLEFEMTATVRAGIFAAILISGVVSGCGSGPKEARFLEAGIRYLTRKNTARAIIEFKNAVQAAPQSAEPEYQLGLAYMEAGDFRSGVAHLMKAGDLNPKHA